MNKATKISLSIILAIVMILSVCSIGIWAIITKLMPTKIAVNDYHASTLKNVEDVNQKFIVNVNYYSNKDNTGIELFEIKLNNYMDSEQIGAEDASTYGLGLQFLGDVHPVNFFRYCNVVSEYGLFGINKVYERGYTPYFDVSIIKPMSSVSNSIINEYFELRNGTTCYKDIYQYNVQNSVPFPATITDYTKYFFRISIGDDLFGMRFKGSVDEAKDNKFNHNIYELSKVLFDLVQSDENLDGYLTIQIADLFDFYKYDGKTFADPVDTSSTDGKKIVEKVVASFTVRITTHTSGATKASDSMFGMIKNSANFKLANSIDADDYFNGHQNAIFNEYYFDYKKKADTYNTYDAYLSDKAIQYLNEYPTQKIDILVDTDTLSANSLKFGSFNVASLLPYKDRFTSIKYKVAENNETMIYEVKIWF